MTHFKIRMAKRSRQVNGLPQLRTAALICLPTSLVPQNKIREEGFNVRELIKTHVILAPGACGPGAPTSLHGTISSSPGRSEDREVNSDIVFNGQAWWFGIIFR